MKRIVLLIVALGLAASSGCSASTSSKEKPPGDSAVWYLDKSERPTAESSSFTAAVTRVDCNGGVTGEVLTPTVSYGDEEIVVTFQVAPRQAGDATCQGNNAVPFVVRLSEPIGTRALVDGECRDPGEAASTSFCDPDEVRYKP